MGNINCQTPAASSHNSELAFFLAKLGAVNWIERRAEKEKAIRSSGRDLWANLGIVIREACESFNEHYGREYSKVTVQAENGRVRVTRQVSVVVVAGEPTLSEDVSLQIMYEPKHFRISSVCANEAKVQGSVEIEFNPDEHAKPFLSNGENRITDDEASRILLAEFLFHERFAVRR